MNPIDRYLKSMMEVCPDINEVELLTFKDSLIIQTYEPKQLIFEKNHTHSHIHFIVEGLARAYYLDEQGNEKTTWFIQEGEFITDYPSFLSGKESHYDFQALEATKVVSLPKKAINKAYQDHASLQQYGRIIAEYILQIQQNRIESFLFKSAKERYLDFMDSNKDLANRISLAHLASYIGIERQSLTRIRKELLSK